jgi:hypothetical protein
MFRSKFDQNTWTFISVWYSPSLRMLGFVRWKLKINTPNWNCKGVCQVRSICQLLVEPLFLTFPQIMFYWYAFYFFP